LLADSVGLALNVVLETLTPAERLAFVLHDMFAVPFDEIAPMVGRCDGPAERQGAPSTRSSVRERNTRHLRSLSCTSPAESLARSAAYPMSSAAE
jgi:hypothetical protein